MKRIRKAKKGLDSIAMKRSIQEQLAKEMRGMNAFERWAYIKRQVQESPFANAIKSPNPSLEKKKDLTKKQDFEEKKNQLEQRMGVVEQGLVRCGVRVAKLGTDEVIELFYKIFNPGESEKPIKANP